MTDIDLLKAKKLPDKDRGAVLFLKVPKKKYPSLKEASGKAEEKSKDFRYGKVFLHAEKEESWLFRLQEPERVRPDKFTTIMPSEGKYNTLSKATKRAGEMVKEFGYKSFKLIKEDGDGRHFEFNK